MIHKLVDAITVFFIFIFIIYVLATLMTQGGF